MKLLESFGVDLSRNYTNDLRDVPSDSLWMMLKNWQFGLLTDIDQNSGIKFDPKLFSWFTLNFNYSVNFRYSYNRQQTIAAKSATQGTTFSANGSLNFGTLMKTIYKPAAKGRSNAAAAAKPRVNPPGARDAGTKEKDAKEKDEKKGFSFPIMGIVSGFFNAFDPMSLKYSNRSNVTRYGLTDIPTMRYQIGLTDDPGVEIETMTQSGGAVTIRDSRNSNENYGISSGIKVGRNVTLSLNYDETYSLNASTTTTGQRSKSWLIAGDQSGMPFPTWNLRINGLEKLPLVKKVFSRISVEHGVSGSSNGTFNVENSIEKATKQDYDTQFRPLIGINFQMKNNISFNVRYNASTKESKTLTSGEASTRTSAQDISVTANYTQKGNFRLPIPFLRSKRLQNSIDFALTFTLGNNVTEKNKGLGYEISAETSKWILKPTANYSFSNRVRGGTYFEIGQTHNKLIGDTTFKEFGIDVSISISGS
ncbi:MAG: hypothetical protein EHM72_11630 [Calditrichaeota bacterium]|nr:MAG: hypothetical protein EHM72_11630 [Calditrichota bacterium]